MMGSERTRVRKLAAVGCFASVALASLVSIVSVVALEGEAFADASPAEKETARALMTDGRQKREQNDFAAALKSFEAADALMHVPTTGLEVARTHVALGHLVEGRDALRRVLLIPTRADDPAPFQEARTAAERLDSELTDRIPAIKLVVRAAPSPPWITVDGIHLPPEAAGVPFRLNPGHHEVTGKVGETKVVKQVDVRERELADVSLDFSGAVAPPSVGSSQDASQASSDGSTSSSGSSHTLTYIAFGVGGAGIAAGVVTGLLAMGAKSSAQGGCVDGRCPPATWGDVDSAHSFATISTVAFIVGGVGVGAGVVSLLVGGKSSARATGTGGAKPHATPWIGAGSAGVTGTF